MRYGSVCSGIEAATAAWHPLGWEPAFFSEIEAFPSAVLKHHYPDVPLHGDFTTIGQHQYGRIDLLVGGTPCQSFSVAGLRGGLDDDRGNLALEFCRLAQREQPRWIVWENVPGVLSSGGGRDFGSILGALEDLGYGLAYRVLDAQHFGVPQRRRRVFVVGYLGDWRPAAAVLFERHSLSGHPAPRREARKDAAGGTSGGTSGGSFTDVAPTLRAGGNTTGGHRPPGTDVDTCDSLIPVQVVGALTAKGPTTMGSPEVDGHHYIPMAVRTAQTSANGHGISVSHTLDQANGQAVVYGLTTEQTPWFAADLALTLTKQSPTGGGQPQAVAYSIMPMNSGKDYKARETDVAQPLMAGGPVGGNQGGDFIAQAIAFSAKDYGGDAGPLAPTLRSGNHNTSHANGGVMPAVAYTIHGTGGTTSVATETETASCLRARPPGAIENSTTTVAVAYDMRGREGGAQFEGPHDTANIRAASGGTSRSFVASYAVRRLTPVECERLQGFPDNFTDIPWRKKPAGECPDGPRYKALGNSMAVPVMRWIGERIQLIDDLLTLI